MSKPRTTTPGPTVAELEQKAAALESDWAAIKHKADVAQHVRAKVRASLNEARRAVVRARGAERGR